MDTFSNHLTENSNINILLVEDDAMNQFIAKKFLSKWGFQFSVANNGREAIELIKSKKFSIVLMDIHMPEMDGGEAARQIRAMDEHYFKTVPIIAFSAVVETKEKAESMGMTDFASKPINPSELQTKISLYLSDCSEATSARKLNIDFDMYTDGDDEFKQELASLMITNLHELGRSVDAAATSEGGTEQFHKILHKVKPTLSMLNDSEMSEIIELLKVIDLTDPAFDELKKQFHNMNQQLIMAIENEMKLQPVLVQAKAA